MKVSVWVARHDDKGLIRELQFLDAYLNIEDYQELTLIDELLELEMVIKERVAERFAFVLDLRPCLLPLSLTFALALLPLSLTFALALSVDLFNRDRRFV